jgi:Nucleotidyl transferase AbiEii toxin, Type IV TA system
MKTAEIPTAGVPVYEELLSRNGRWAMDQGGFHFQEQSDVQKTLRRIAHRLDDLGIDYAVAGGMALFKHGFRRFTEDVDILVSRESLRAIHEHLEGLGYIPPFTGSKNLRDTEFGVRIEFLVAGEFPGDGKPKPVAFPDPAQVGVEIDGVRYLSLPSLVELKLASGMTGGIHRMKDLTDVVELIKTIRLSAEFAEQLNPYVRDKYLELWRGIQESPIGPVES